MTVENFVRIVWTAFEKIEKKSKNGCFFGHFWANFGYVSHIQDECTSSQDRPVDGLRKIDHDDRCSQSISMVYYMYSILDLFVSPLRFFLQNLQLKVMELLETVLCLLRVG